MTPPAAAHRSTTAHCEKNGGYFLPERAPLPVSACRSFQWRRGSLESFHRSCKAVEILERNSLRRESVDHRQEQRRQRPFLVERGCGYSWVQSLLTLNSQLWLVGQSYHKRKELRALKLKTNHDCFKNQPTLLFGKHSSRVSCGVWCY